MIQTFSGFIGLPMVSRFWGVRWQKGLERKAKAKPMAESSGETAGCRHSFGDEGKLKIPAVLQMRTENRHRGERRHFWIHLPTSQ